MSGHVCDCEPDVWPDGSVSHEETCAIYPWCPHEMGAYVCGIPCGCQCAGCTRLTEAALPADPRIPTSKPNGEQT
jgi:hypothetical protein